MSTYGYIRETAGNGAPACRVPACGWRSLQVQEAEILQAANAAKPGSDFGGVFFDKAEPDEPGAGIALAGVAKMLQTLKPGDTLILSGLDRLGKAMKVSMETIEFSRARGRLVNQPAAAARKAQGPG